MECSQMHNMQLQLAALQQQKILLLQSPVHGLQALKNLAEAPRCQTFVDADIPPRGDHAPQNQARHAEPQRMALSDKAEEVAQLAHHLAEIEVATPDDTLATTLPAPGCQIDVATTDAPLVATLATPERPLVARMLEDFINKEVGGREAKMKKASAIGGWFEAGSRGRFGARGPTGRSDSEETNLAKAMGFSEDSGLFGSRSPSACPCHCS